MSIRGITSITDLASIDDTCLATLSFLVFTVIEEAVFLPLRDYIIDLLPEGIHEVRNYSLLFVMFLFYFC